MFFSISLIAFSDPSGTASLVKTAKQCQYRTTTWSLVSVQNILYGTWKGALQNIVRFHYCNREDILARINEKYYNTNFAGKAIYASGIHVFVICNIHLVEPLLGTQRKKNSIYSTRLLRNHCICFRGPNNRINYQSLKYLAQL